MPASAHEPRKGPRALPQLERGAQLGPERERRGLQVVADLLGECGRVARPQRVEHARVDIGGAAAHADAVLRTQGVEVRIHLGRRQAFRRRHDDPVEPALREGGAQLIAAARADRRSAHQCERHVGPEPRGELVQLGGGGGGPPERRAGDQRSRGIR